MYICYFYYHYNQKIACMTHLQFEFCLKQSHTIIPYTIYDIPQFFAALLMVSAGKPICWAICSGEQVSWTGTSEICLQCKTSDKYTIILVGVIHAHANKLRYHILIEINFKQRTSDMYLAMMLWYGICTCTSQYMPRLGYFKNTNNLLHG